MKDIQEVVEVKFPSEDGQDDGYWKKRAGIGQAATEVEAVEHMPRRVLRGDFDGIDTSAQPQGPIRMPSVLLGIPFER